MVLFKRKPMTHDPHPQNIKDDTEVWVIPETGEIYLDYERYLKRYDFLHQKKFTDGINGKSGLTYADAVASENQSLADIEVFPEVLRDPILRKVQFSTVSRMDELVNIIYNDFKREFFPGEDVLVTLPDRGDATGAIREKAKFPMIKGPDGSVQRNAFARYFIRLHDTPGDEALVDEHNVRRDRKVYSKLNLRAFLKNSLERDSYLHAPWLVKEHLAVQYRLPMKIPEHLLKDAALLHEHPARAPRGRQPRPAGPEEAARLQQELQIRQQTQRQNGTVNRPQNLPAQVAATPPRPAPPVIKYPIEDLDVHPRKDLIVRPQLSFLTDEMAEYVKTGRTKPLTHIKMETVGMLLEIWNTLNVQAEVYELDSFTFDDFVDAMSFTTESESTECQLLDETFCAVLKQLVTDKGKVEVSLPKMAEEADDDDSEMIDVDDSTVSTPVAPVPAHSTRSRLSHVSNVSEQSLSPARSFAKMHNASEALADFDWVDALARREMANGGWQMILVGILNQLSHSPNMKPMCDQVLAHLTPTSEAHTSKELVKFFFKTMDVNLRAAVLQPLTMLSSTTKAIKNNLEECSELQTQIRKEKIEAQREKKAAMENLAYKDRDSKLAAEAVKVAEEAEIAAANAITEASMIGSSEPEEEPATGRRSRKRKRGNEMTAEEKARKDALDAAKVALTKRKKEHEVLLRDIKLLRDKILENERQVNKCDAQLREADVQRTKVLGKDRYCNRYYWFERNGQPFGGLDTSSTADHGYANGRLWVQGPSEMEREGFIDMTAEQQAIYRANHGLTAPERRRLEEGATSLLSANEWGFFEDPAIIDSLIGWLDDRGEREKKLRKELYDWRDKIATYMRAHKDFLNGEAAKKLEAEEEPKKGIATRRQAVQEKAEAGETCLRWRNSEFLSDHGHLHSENPPAKKQKKSKTVTAVAINGGRTSRSRK